MYNVVGHHFHVSTVPSTFQPGNHAAGSISIIVPLELLIMVFLRKSFGLQALIGVLYVSSEMDVYVMHANGKVC